ncbi:MAG: fumarylacetoacetate hydrolase family protein [Candidatus Limnocylindrales bacterium]
MRLFAFLADDGPAHGVLTSDDRVIRLESAAAGLDLILADGRLDEVLAEAAERAAGPTIAGTPRGELTPLPAIEFPGKVVAVGLNYADHLREQGMERPPAPTLFAKFATAIVADGEPIVRPEGTQALDLEVELGVVIGRRARRVPAERAMDHVAGYVVLNDVTARDWQGNKAALPPGGRGDGQWVRAKSSDTFLPIGPVFASTAAIPDPAALRLRSWRIPGSGPDAGRPLAMQDGHTSDMVWSVPELIEFISRQITLEPGDLIPTGTPSGVGVFRDPPVFLQPGDRVRCEVDGIGAVENPVIDWSDVPEDTLDGQA